MTELRQFGLKAPAAYIKEVCVAHTALLSTSQLTGSTTSLLNLHRAIRAPTLKQRKDNRINEERISKFWRDQLPSNSTGQSLPNSCRHFRHVTRLDRGHWLLQTSG